VPPLVVVGLTLESGVPDESLGALLLFGTNVAAIIATGTLVLLLYRIRDVAAAAGLPVGRLTGRTLVTVGGMVLLVAVPLAFVSPYIAIAIYIAVAFLWLVPDRRFERQLFERPTE